MLKSPKSIYSFKGKDEGTGKKTELSYSSGSNPGTGKDRDDTPAG